MIATQDRTPAARPAAQAAMAAAALRDFQWRYPAYAGTAVLDDMRARDYARLDVAGHVYLDYTGGGLYAESQLARHRDLLAGAVFGNPHSQNLPSREMSARVEATRAQILEFFRASPEEYEVIFTPNATGALRLVGESYPFGPGSRFLLTFDNHNSVNGIRQFARARGASVSYVPLTTADLRVSEEALARHLQAATPVRRRRLAGRRSGSAARSLFAFPAQSNFSGVQHPLAWIAQAQAAGYDVLLDAAAFAPASRLDLSRWHPDYVSLSFYKIFGYPTGIGALLVRRPALARLRRPWYAGGTITFSSVRAEAAPGGGFYLTPGPAGFEDGTVDYLGIPAVGIGLDHISSVGIETIHTRVMCLTGWLLDALGALRHSNGSPVVRIYGPAGTDRRGATIAMNFFDPAGVLIDSVRVERRANRAGISLRSGCHCNPGVREVALGFSAAGDGGRLQGQGPAALPGVPPGDRREDHRGGAGLARPGHHLRRRLPVLGLRRRLPRPPLRHAESLSRPARVPAASGTAITARAGITVPAGSGDQRDDTTFKATRNTITAANALPRILNHLRRIIENSIRRNIGRWPRGRNQETC